MRWPFEVKFLAVMGLQDFLVSHRWCPLSNNRGWILGDDRTLIVSRIEREEPRLTEYMIYDVVVWF